MSTRANFLIKVDQDHYQQYYCHCDGYKAGLGEALRRTIVYSIGLQTFNPTTPLQKIVEQTLSIETREDNEGIGHYNREDLYSTKDYNHLHPDIEYCYLIEFNFPKGPDLYGKACWNNYTDNRTVGEVVADLARPENHVDLRQIISRTID